MPLLQQRLQNDEEERVKADEAASKGAIRPTEDENDYAQSIINTVSERFRDQISNNGITHTIEQQIADYVKGEVIKYPLEYINQARIEKIVLSSIIGLGPLDAFMKDSAITEIIVQRYNHISVEKKGIVQKTGAEFVSEGHLVNVINRIIQPVGRQINLHTPLVDARLSDGSRINATIPPISPDGATLTIRRFPERAYTGKDFLAFGSLDEKMLFFLMKAVEGKGSAIVSGGTGSGKTTMLNLLSTAIPNNELVITIEDSCELQLKQPNVRRLESRVSTSDNGVTSIDVRALVKNALRMRPDRIIVGEIRDGTVVDMISAMSSGHEGSLSTVHANSPKNLVNARIPILYSMYGDSNFTREAQSIQMAEALDLIVHVSRMKDGSRKVTHITHVDGLRENKVVLNDIFVLRDNKFISTGYVPKRLLEKLANNGVKLEERLFGVR